MNATQPVGDYEISSLALWDSEEELWYLKAGVKSRTGKMIIHITAWGKSPEVARNRAETYCRIMSALKPPNYDLNDLNI